VTPTLEQQAITDAYLAKANLVIEAGAGTGKTSTLRLLASAAPERRGVYVAYNRAIADDAKRSFPPT
jgi:ABC-type transport system involved in cytochrome c biogenesis ATPase subunit